MICDTFEEICETDCIHLLVPKILSLALVEGVSLVKVIMLRISDE